MAKKLKIKKYETIEDRELKKPRAAKSPESDTGDLTHTSSRTLRIRPSKRESEYEAMMRGHEQEVERTLKDAPKKKLKIKKKNR